MTRPLHKIPALFLGAACLTLVACSTQEIGADPIIIPDTTPSADNGALEIAFAPSQIAFADQQANASPDTTIYHVFLDGRQLAWRSVADGSLQPFIVYAGAAAGINYPAAGTHHFEVRVAGGGRTIFAGDGEIVAGATTRLYLFGLGGTVEGRFVAYPSNVADGTAHVSVINLVRTGQSIEVVSCADLAHCASLSPRLAVGETFAADYPMDATQDWPTGRFVVSNGAALGYRQVPTTAVPEPPVIPLSGVQLQPALPTSATLMAAPVYMSAAGNIQSSF
jgi:hypothetical protein